MWRTFVTGREIVSVRERKRSQRWANRRADSPRREQRRREIRCFWTWPLGHTYDPATGRCAGCNQLWDTLGSI